MKRSGCRVARVTRAWAASSIAICTAELPAPTITTRFPANGPGRRYSDECSTVPANSAKPGRSGRWGRLNPPVAATTIGAVKVSPPTVTTSNMDRPSSWTAVTFSAR
jgi:hypothetical protein